MNYTFNKDDILVTSGYEGIYRKIGENTYQKLHERHGGICNFPKKSCEKLGELSKASLISYLDKSYGRLDDYVGDILSEGLQAFEPIEEIVLNILEDTLFFAGHINKTFLNDFLDNNAFLDEEWLQCLEFRHWKLGLLNHYTSIDEYDFTENVLENIMYLICKLKDYVVKHCKGDRINLF